MSSRNPVPEFVQRIDLPCLNASPDWFDSPAPSSYALVLLLLPGKTLNFHGAPSHVECVLPTLRLRAFLPRLEEGSSKDRDF
jgi:hypothetical protein